VRVVERIVEKVVIRHDLSCLDDLRKVRKLISAATDRLTQNATESTSSAMLTQVLDIGTFPMMAHVERSTVLAAYRRSNRRPLEAARLLGIGKTTVYRKLREIGEAAA
jgi:transcriptional regulator of acetoin/glycerol metabolism